MRNSPRMNLSTDDGSTVRTDGGWEREGSLWLKSSNIPELITRFKR